MATVFRSKTGEIDVLPDIWQERTTCRNCESKDLVECLDLGTQYLPRFPQEPDLSLPKAPLALVMCARCGLLQLRHTVERDLLFRDYWYRSSINDSMRTALKDLVNDALRKKGSGVWLDIGANDGYLLSCVPGRFTKVACEPAQDFSEGLRRVADLVIPDYFTASKASVMADVITSAAMFYDLDDPHTFLGDIATCLKPDGIWINQLNDAPGMLKANAFDSLCHEHLCYYDLWTLEAMYRQHGLKIVDISFNDVNGGSVRITASKAGDPMGLHGIPKTMGIEVERFGDRVRKWKERMTDLFQGSVRDRAWCYGASTKGMVLLQYLECSDAFEAVADRNPLKEGLYMAGSWLPIKTEDDLRRAKPTYVLMLPWAFRKEFVERESVLRQTGSTLIFPLPNPELVL